MKAGSPSSVAQTARGIRQIEGDLGVALLLRSQVVPSLPILLGRLVARLLLIRTSVASIT
jgi:hypothetical protein